MLMLKTVTVLEAISKPHGAPCRSYRPVQELHIRRHP